MNHNKQIIDGDGSLPRGSISRRHFLGTLAATTGAALLPMDAAAAQQVDKDYPWHQQVDLLVVGSGAAGSCAALYGRRAGAEVLLLEKAGYYGGTTQKSQGAYWIPNNSLMRDRGLQDPRREALRYMARLSYPTEYQPDHPTLGLTGSAYELIATYYDQGPRIVDELAQMGVLQSTFMTGFDGSDFPDYYAHLAENRAPIGRILIAKDEQGHQGMGDELIRQLQSGVQRAGIEVKLGCRAQQLLLNEQGGVAGLLYADGEGKTFAVRARKGVVFGSGGFIHHAQMRKNFLRGPVYGGCTVAAAEGDFVTIGAAAGAALGNMNNAWWAQILLEHAIANSAVGMNVFVPPGDAMIQVNRYGRRFVNEKFVYNERAQAHFVWEANRAEYPNLFPVMIYDHQVAEQYGGVFPIPAGQADYLLSGETLEQLVEAIKARFTALSAHTGGYQLDAQFSQHLSATIDRFNEFARQGKDEDFNRGEVPSELFFNKFYTPPDGQLPEPNPTMRPLADRGPYYAMILAPGVLDTKGGPRINANAQVLNNYNPPIAGLYGAGNCIAAPAAQAYWSAGATIGAAMIYGALAGEHAVTGSVSHA
ncbi:MAG: FAD-dependent oxidoreductase [Gammaproteobacteria bacterium]